MTIDLEFLNQTEVEVGLLLKLLRKYKARATFFVVTEQIEGHKELIKKISRYHEIASHTRTHKNLQKADIKTIRYEIEHSKRDIEDEGIKCHGFRSPYNLPPKNLLGLLRKAEYSYDSSLSSVYFPFRYNYRSVPNNPYVASSKNMGKKGSCLLEMPVSNFSFVKFPTTLSFMKVISPLVIPFDLGEKVFLVHDYDLKKNISDHKASGIVRALQCIRSGKKAFDILENFIKKQSFICSCSDFLDKSQS